MQWMHIDIWIWILSLFILFSCKRRVYLEINEYCCYKFFLTHSLLRPERKQINNLKYSFPELQQHSPFRAVKTATRILEHYIEIICTSLMPPKNNKVLFPHTKQEFCMFEVMWLTSNTLILITFCFAVNVAKKKEKNQAVFIWKYIKNKIFHVSKLLTPPAAQLDSFCSQRKIRIRMN